MLKKFSSLFFLVAICKISHSQVGGQGVFYFLDIPASARIAAMGGTIVSVKDNDLNVALQNPAALNPSMNNYLLLSSVSYIDRIAFHDAAYARDFGKYGTYNLWMHYANYGTFTEADNTGAITGEFNASDYALSFGWGYSLNKYFSVGANLKGIFSDYYFVNSWGIAADASCTFHDSASGWTATILARNAGIQIKPYTEGLREDLPVEVVGGFSKKFAHLPARLNFTARHLEKFDITYIDPNDQSNTDPLTGEFNPEKVSFLDKFIRHWTVGAEILLSRNFHLRASYNFQRRQELMIDSRPGTVGLSFGFGLKISKFIISYGRGGYHLAGASNHFSIAANLDDFVKKPKPE